MTESLTKYSASPHNTPTWNEDQIALIKSQIAVNCTDSELALFGQVCQRTGLDPFSRQIYAIKRNQYNSETRQKEPKMSIQVSIDGFRTIAARSGLYGGSSTEWCGDHGIWRDVWLGNGHPAAAKTTVYRIGSPHAFVAVAKFDNYAISYNGKLSGLWEKMPDLLIAKCSESLALRKAFPAELSGLYTVEEFPPPEYESIVTYTHQIGSIAERRQALKDCFNTLEWSEQEQKDWAQTISNKPSKQWELKIWDAALVDLHDRIDAEDRAASGFPPADYLREFS